jgi:DNA polymerase-2
MHEYKGWFLDVYASERGITVWLLGDDGGRHPLTQPFPVTFYASGAFPRLRQLWIYLRTNPSTRLRRTQRVELFLGPLDVLEIQAAEPMIQQRLFRDIRTRFPDLDYFDADIPLSLRYMTDFNLSPLSRCHVMVDRDGVIASIIPLDSPWDIDTVLPPFRLLTIEPDVDPFRRQPTRLIIANERGQVQVDLEPSRLLLATINALLKRHDPDIVLTRWGDTWLFPLLMALQRELGASYFNPNRDLSRQPLRRKANSYFTYGQVIYRGEQTHLFGRWHIDRTNAMMFDEYGLHGIFEQARVTGLPVQEVARKSPGAGISAMQMLVALRRGVLVPYQKQQVEQFKSASELIRADRGGMVYQPITGIHQDVAEIDFVSMYPSIMARFNISPETVGVYAEGAQFVPELGIPIDQSREGLIPATLKPLLSKRIAIKQRMATMNPYDCRYKSLKARSVALKWLLVVSFGYLGYKNARFGRIEGHEAVTAYSREMLLRAKEAAEDAGYCVLHMYVDGLWVKHEEGNEITIGEVLDEITARTGLPISLEGIYRFVAFLPSRLDERVPVPNRYYGIFQDGSLKMRGIETRRHDTPPFVARVQKEILQQLANANSDRPLETQLPGIVDVLRQRLDELHSGKIEVTDLLVTHRVSRTSEEYKASSPAARAMQQLQAVGKQLRPGQSIRFLYMQGKPGVHAWNLPTPPNLNSIDTHRYSTLLIRAASSILQPFIEETRLRSWVLGEAEQLPLKLWGRGLQDNRFLKNGAK